MERTRDNKEKIQMTLRGFRDTFLVKKENKKGIFYWFSKLVRDLTVQRKGVWTLNMMMEYFADCAMGNTDNNALHYMDLKSGVDNAGKIGDYGFAKHLKTFLDRKKIYAHIDGGNRTDAIEKTLTNKIKVKKGIYNYGETTDGKMIIEEVLEDTYFDDLDEKTQNIMLDYSAIEIWVYYDLTKKKRKQLFKKLNDGVNLIAAEIRNCEESEVCDINRKHDLEYDNVYLDVKSLTEEGISRWKLAEYVAKLKYAKRNLSYDENGDIIVNWSSGTDIDKDYKSGSSADLNADYEEKWYVNNYLSYLKILQEKKLALKEKGWYIDLFLLLAYMDKKDISLTHTINKDKKLTFIKLFDKQIWKWFAESDKDKTNVKYITKYSQGNAVYTVFAGLYSKSNDLVLTQRLNRWVKEFLNVLLDKGLLVQETARKTKNDTHTVAKLLKKQNGITKISGEKVNTLKIATTQKINTDHNIDVRNGGADSEENKSVELDGDNKSKGAKKDTKFFINAETLSQEMFGEGLNSELH